MIKTNILLIGPPASGKGTQGRWLEEQFGYRHISTGDLFKDKVASGDPYAIELNERYIKKGSFFPDDVAIDFVNDNLSTAGNIFDGVPRNLTQAAIMDPLITIDLAIELQLNKEVAIERMSARLFCPACKRTYGPGIPSKTQGSCNCGTYLTSRPEDKHGERRWSEYQEKTFPLIAHYEPRGIIRKVNADQSPSLVSLDLYHLVSRGKL